MKLTDILTLGTVKVPLDSMDKESILGEMVDILDQEGQIEDREEVLRAVLDRERLMSTGIGNGVAIPHGKTGAVPRLVVAFGKTKEPVEFEALDGQPVQLIFLLVGPEDSAGPHVRALSRISRLMSSPQFRESLLKADSSDEVMRVITTEESRRFSTS